MYLPRDAASCQHWLTKYIAESKNDVCFCECSYIPRSLSSVSVLFYCSPKCFSNGSSFFQATFIFSLVKYTPLKFNNVTPYPWWGNALGWWFTLSSTLLVPIFMIYNLSVTPGTLWQVRMCVSKSGSCNSFCICNSRQPVSLFVRGSLRCALQLRSCL